LYGLPDDDEHLVVRNMSKTIELNAIINEKTVHLVGSSYVTTLTYYGRSVQRVKQCARGFRVLKLTTFFISYHERIKLVSRIPSIFNKIGNILVTSIMIIATVLT